MFRLMIKSHNVTGLNYLCVTERKKYIEYRGSGLYWTRHLKVHGFDISTVLLYESETKSQDFIDTCLYYSDLFSVVESDDWANLVPENANSVGKRTAPTEETCAKIKRGLAKFFNKENPEGNASRLATSKRMFKRWSDPKVREQMSIERYRFLTVPENIKRLSDSCKAAWNNLSPDEKVARGENISQTRLRLPKEKKILRAQRVRDSLNKNESFWEHVERMKTTRRGSNNPNSRKICWFGEIFGSRAEFRQYISTSSWSISQAISMLKSTEYPECYIINSNKTSEYKCVHCGIVSSNAGIISRWHNDNCKNKVTVTPSKSDN